jgi:hypothetical protein
MIVHFAKLQMTIKTLLPAAEEQKRKFLNDKFSNSGIN